MNSTPADFVELFNGDIQVALQKGSSIHLRAITAYKDPVELNAEEARELADLLMRFANRVDSADC